MTVNRLTRSELRLAIDGTSLSFSDTSELAQETLPWVGQQRAQQAAQFGLTMEQPDYNLFVLGEVGSGRSSLLMQSMMAVAANRAVPPDLCYLHNFDAPERPRALRMPAGQGRQLRQLMLALAHTLQIEIPLRLNSEDFKSDSERIRNAYKVEESKAYAETGHLCISTMHASNASQAVKRILNFFPESNHAQLRMDLSLNLQAIVSQRLLPGIGGARALATEVLLQSAYVSDLIERGAVDELRQSLEKTSVMGTHSFDQSLLELYQRGLIDQEAALAHADSRTDLGLRMRLHSSHDPH